MDKAEVPKISLGTDVQLRDLLPLDQVPPLGQNVQVGGGDMWYNMWPHKYKESMTVTFLGKISRTGTLRQGAEGIAGILRVDSGRGAEEMSII